MATPVGLLLRSLHIDVPTILAASKVLVAAGALVVAAVWAGLAPWPLPTWLRVYGGVAAAFPVLYFLTRPLVPPLPRVRDATCPRCDKGVHYAGYECPDCGVLTFGNDRATQDVDA